MGLRMNEHIARNNVTNFRGLQSYIEQPKDKKRSWILVVTDWIGITMPQPERPNGWQLNPATVTLSLLIAGGLVTGGYLWGENITERKHLMERIQKAEADAAEAKKFSVYAAAGADEAAGHKPNQKEQPKK